MMMMLTMCIVAAAVQVKMSAGDEITIIDITHPDKLKVRSLFLAGKLESLFTSAKFAFSLFLVSCVACVSKFPTTFFFLLVDGITFC